MKKIISVLIALCSVIVPLACGAGTSALDDPQISNAASAYLYNIENETAVYNYKGDESVYPTSTVKIMTGIVALEALAIQLL